MERVDLHIHTSASDGTFGTDEIVDIARSEGLSAIAVTDHDSIDGVKNLSKTDFEVVPGIEFSTKYFTKVHILGYYIDTDNRELNDMLQFMVDDRDKRNIQSIELMAKDGIRISYDEMKDRFGEVVGWPHLSAILLEKGIVGSVEEAFTRFFNRGMKYWVPRTTIPLEKCVELILGAGGIAVLAHPYEYRFEKNSLPQLIEHCMSLGVRGIECRHPSHTPGQMAYLENLAGDYGLLKVGGSDFHGNVKPDIKLGTGNGQICVPYSWLEQLKAERDRIS